MILIFDTETSTFPSALLPANHPNQARIVQLAWLLLDEKFVERACFNSLIRIPSSCRIAEGARNAHGISEEDCAKYGVTMEYALQTFIDVWRESKTIVAHNIKFDEQLVKIEEAIIYNQSEGKFSSNGKAFCTMEAMTPICQLPFASNRKSWGGKQYKWPTLQEAHSFAFGQQFEGAHDALADVRATARIYKWLKERESSCNPYKCDDPYKIQEKQALGAQV